VLNLRFTYFLLSGVACLNLAACRVQQPGGTETATLQWVKHHVSIGGKREQNPVSVTAENIESGKLIFGYYCVVCYGRDGQDTGVPFAARTLPPMFSATPMISSNGSLRMDFSPSQMAPPKGTFNEDEMRHIVVYLRHLPPAGSLGDPRAYSGDEYDDASPK
jgi:mono/diheme cytochrome c family protein